MMLAVPYLSVAGVGFMIYRGVKKNEAHRAAARGLGNTSREEIR